MVKLSCVIVGVPGDPFQVEIDEICELVAGLKDAIKKEKPDSIKCDADKLQLFKAAKEDRTFSASGAEEEKKDFRWLKAASDDVKKLKHGEKTAAIEAVVRKDQVLRGKETVSDVLMGMESPSISQIHVLVVLPEDSESEGGTSAQPAEKERLLKFLREQAADKKRKRYWHSEMDMDQGWELLDDFDLTVKPVSTVHAEADPADSFNWQSDLVQDGQEVVLTEEQQRGRYREYVERNIGAVLKENKLCVTAVDEGENVLSVDVPKLGIELRGRTDLLVLSDIVEETSDYLMHLPEVKMLIEVKRDAEASDFQALSELIALDILAEDPVMALLTDLNQSWKFFWVSKKSDDSDCICKATIKSPGEAFQVIRALLTASAETKLPCFHQPLKRLKLSQHRGYKNAECLQQYYKVAEVSGPDYELARAVAEHLVRSMPGYCCANESEP
ncbi:crn2-like protein [Phytophthora sojae]|uniref:Crinkler effector protein 161 n=1 Tax=Phytophthora sojae (strain P6497) TaxID=1094619 RepID=CR161_PHYSP|nr:crn2-like protein [Phytophthora sojae]G4YUT3.1 RecName: Full=Crinkler effector protein 161; Flags: Precursor [Phytophthora sojae strain P6497]EGZ26008.1 crn2-like protein [Phytophthora sojae]|eukprot:XP_009521296.1 crn2-like protein [Phytophthora sojae]